MYFFKNNRLQLSNYGDLGKVLEVDYHTVNGDRRVKMIVRTLSYNHIHKEYDISLGNIIVN